jgi:thiol-disulfide isomerase/thioredoxin
MKKTIITALLALVGMTGQGQEVFFRTDSAVIKGRIEGYSSTMGFQNLTAQVTDVFTGELKTATAEIREDGTFEKRILLHHPILNWFYTSEIHIGKQQVPFYLCPGDTLDITVSFRDGDVPDCEYRGGHFAEVARLLKVRSDYLGLVKLCRFFEGDIEAYNRFADSLYTDQRHMVDDIANKHHFTSFERRLAQCNMAAVFGTAYLSYFSQIQDKMAKDDPAAPYTAGNAMMERLSLPKIYPLLRRLPNNDSLMLATKFFQWYLNGLEFSAPLRYPLFVKRGTVWGNSRDEVTEQLSLYRDTGRQLFASENDVLPMQLLQLHSINEAIGDWLEAGTAEEDFCSVQSFLTHPALQKKAQQILNEQADMDAALPLPAGDAADFVKDILALYPGRYIVLDFWAMWCAPCKAEIRTTKDFRHRLHERSDVKFVFLANEHNPNREDYLAFVRENLEGEKYIIIDDNRFHQLQELFGFNAIPFNVTLTPDGRIVRDGLLLRAAEVGYDSFILMLEEMKERLK